MKRFTYLLGEFTGYITLAFLWFLGITVISWLVFVMGTLWYVMYTVITGGTLP